VFFFFFEISKYVFTGKVTNVYDNKVKLGRTLYLESN